MLTPAELRDVFEDLKVAGDGQIVNLVTSKGIPFSPSGSGRPPTKRMRRIPCEKVFKVYDIDGVVEDYRPALPVCRPCILRTGFN